ncbi:reverse transcriptase domain, Reverse transcriptase zinc-binding domain protein [Artemisia annua]|uniref:Reverse transcriptase domain, Reverse transcriptase zinc-binding domain protein n=1 Tax=Artemisia annua TaxID=35608 RepID=A0A2U1P4K5_ARTAN|nr:reverse transcriptase domain, Reverse transcriptase zinc-binding domain protein [Artemisia annua]
MKKNVQAFHDDLLLFARGDVDSARTIMEALKEFKFVSDLVPSLPKSTAFFCNVPNHIKTSIRQFIPFQAGVLLIKYLDVPLISYRLLYKDFKILVKRVQNQISDWKNKSLSFAGRLQVVLSVISSMHGCCERCVRFNSSTWARS